MEGNNTLLKGNKRSHTLSSAHTHIVPIPKPTPPTTSLPPLARLLSTSTEQIATALTNLRSLYFPPPPPPLPKNITIPKRNLPKHLMHGSSSVPDSGYASADDEDDEDVDYYGKGKEETRGGRGVASVVVEAWAQPEENGDAEAELEILRADPFERAFAIKWVTGFISRCDTWVELVEEGEDEFEETESASRAKLVEDATTILSLFSGDEEEEEFSVTRTFEFPLASDAGDEGNEEGRMIRVELNDAPLSSQDHTSVGLQSWASSILLSEKMAASPSAFLLPQASPTQRNDALRILEMGAGTGLLSIVAAKILAEVKPEPIIVATDYHPDVLENLKRNVHTNFPPTHSSSFDSTRYPVDVRCLDWENPRFDAPLDERFEIILAADVVYHPDHARWIKSCVEKLLKLPDTRGLEGNSERSGKGGVFWMMIAIRSTGRHEGLHTTVDELFTRSVEPDTQELVIFGKEEVRKQDGVGRSDEGGYALYKIGWSG
ncbi:hypothetical protein NP233_g658 [Leucocoprinus birnbaumii]|uniref:S-adenosylmethionine-dependent methyltransferase n=1 Tax=Leucocoprinus birnbaumii TaxID=56174 RepID=A0AAD5YWJ2_9AGAR|nr:hypothetical protein NP233_g658 [Leucocoprinus birnbaumii]